MAHKPQWKMNGRHRRSWKLWLQFTSYRGWPERVGHTKLLHVLLTCADMLQRVKKTLPVPAGRKKPAEPRRSELIFSHVRKEAARKGGTVVVKNRREKGRGEEWLAVSAGGRDLPLLKLPDNLATALVLEVWDGTPPLDAGPSSPLPLHLSPSPLLLHPADTAQDSPHWTEP